MTPIPEHLQKFVWYAPHQAWLKDRSGWCRHDPGAALAARANLSDAYLTGAYLSDAYLTGAYLSGADLSGANLSDAYLTGAYLSGAYLSRANLSGANLSRANLSGTDLSDADLSRANLSDAKSDLFAVLDTAPAEVAGLLLALEEGRVNGSTYTGTCSCLVGTLATVRHVTPNKMECGMNSGRPAERWFLAIRPGDTAEKSQVTRITIEWVKEWQANRAAVTS